MLTGQNGLRQVKQTFNENETAMDERITDDNGSLKDMTRIKTNIYSMSSVRAFMQVMNDHYNSRCG